MSNTNQGLYNSRIIKTYLGLLRQRYSHVNVNELLQHAGMQPYEVNDEGHWFSQEQVNRFYEKLVQVTGHRGIAREAGRYAASPNAIGIIRQYVLSFLGPAKAFEILGLTTPNFTRSARYSASRVGFNKVEITVTPYEGVREEPFQCENRIGFFEAIITVFTGTIPVISHQECIFNGAPSCRYIVTWSPSFSSFEQWGRVAVLGILASVAAVALVMNPEIAVRVVVPFVLTAIVGFTLYFSFREKKCLLEGLDTLRDSTECLLEQINVNYNNALLTNEIGQLISRQTDVDDILESIVQTLHTRLDYDRGLLLLASADKERLEFRAGYGYSHEQLELLNKIAFHLDRPESRGVFVISYREQKPFLINDVNEISGSLSPRSLALAKKMGAQSFICCPIICDGESVGVLAVENLVSKRSLVQSDMSLIMGIAPIVGISIRNAELYDAQAVQFSSTLQALAASIDARDPLTAGHSLQVTEYAVGISQELGFPRDFREMIRVAALLHDYGKIGVPDSILKKEGRLTPEEFEIVKTHSGKTRDILQQINFQGIYQQVPKIAGAHHEKIDGSGYPDGLKGKDIPVGARIIAVADFFEAVTSKRHYREPMPLEEAFRLLKEGSGKHFDRWIVSAFIRYYLREFGDKAGEGEVVLELERKGTKAHDLPSDRAAGHRGDVIPPDMIAGRCAVRVPYRLPVDIVYESRRIAASTFDISTSGMYVAADFEMEIGSEVVLDFSLPGREGPPLLVAGRVAWANPAIRRSRPTYPPGFGIEFKEVSVIVVEQIKGFLRRIRNVETAAA